MNRLKLYGCVWPNHPIPYLLSRIVLRAPVLYCCREYLLEVKVRLLEQLSCGFNSPQLAIEFIQMLLEEYSYLCNSLPSLLYLLEPLVSGHWTNNLTILFLVHGMIVHVLFRFSDKMSFFFFFFAVYAST